MFQIRSSKTRKEATRASFCFYCAGMRGACLHRSVYCLRKESVSGRNPIQEKLHHSATLLPPCWLKEQGSIYLRAQQNSSTHLENTFREKTVDKPVEINEKDAVDVTMEKLRCIKHHSLTVNFTEGKMLLYSGFVCVQGTICICASCKHLNLHWSATICLLLSS